MAWSQNAELLAAYALLGAFATPLLLSTGTNHEAFLFTYLAAIDLATMLLLRAKPWHRLAAPVFLGTVAFFIGWYTEWYSYRDGQGPLTETLAFIALFGLLFALPSVRGWILPDSKPGGFGDTIVPVLLPLANAVFLGLAVYSVLEISSRHAFLAWAMVVLATIYLGTAKVQQSDLARAMHLAISIVFLTVAISLKASGHALTTAWLVEGLLLFWVSTRFAEAEGNTATLLRALSAAAFALGLASLVGHWWWFGTTTLAPNFLNRNLGAAVVALATLSGAAWIAVHLPEPAPDPQTISSPNSRAGRVPLAPGGQPATMLMAALVAVDFVAVLLTTGELGFFFSTTYAHTAFANVPFATALVGLAALAASASAAWRIHQTDALRFPGLLKFAGATDHTCNGTGDWCLVAPLRRQPAAFARHIRVPDVLRRHPAGCRLCAAQRLHPLAGACASPLHDLQGLPLRHAGPERGLSRRQLSGPWCRADGRQLRLSKGLAAPERGG
jgi:uncharacterized membrane protein